MPVSCHNRILALSSPPSASTQMHIVRHSPAERPFLSVLGNITDKQDTKHRIVSNHQCEACKFKHFIRTKNTRKETFKLKNRRESLFL